MPFMYAVAITFRCSLVVLALSSAGGTLVGVVGGGGVSGGVSCAVRSCRIFSPAAADLSHSCRLTYFAARRLACASAFAVALSFACVHWSALAAAPAARLAASLAAVAAAASSYLCGGQLREDNVTEGFEPYCFGACGGGGGGRSGGCGRVGGAACGWACVL